VLIAQFEAFIELLLTVYLTEVLLLEPQWHGEEGVIDKVCDASAALWVTL